MDAAAKDFQAVYYLHMCSRSAADLIISMPFNTAVPWTGQPIQVSSPAECGTSVVFIAVRSGPFSQEFALSGTETLPVATATSTRLSTTTPVAPIDSSTPTTKNP